MPLVEAMSAWHPRAPNMQETDVMDLEQAHAGQWMQSVERGFRAGLLLLLVVTLTLAACGGGGGDAAGTGTSTVPGASGLLPAATAAGATLETDVARLRVLRAGATWRYTGVVRPVGAAARAYTNVVTHTLDATGVMESSTNPLDSGADSQVVRIEAGAVKIALSMADLGVLRTIDFVELRAPVRVGDQITQFDERLADAIADLDGDGRREGLDLAIWTRVIGEEVIDLLHRPGVRAVRVDTSIAMRLRPSASTSPEQPTLTSVQRNWYMAGVGLGRSESETPSELSPGATDLVVEELESWDGLTEGLGAMPPVTGRVPGDDAALGGPRDAVAFSDHAVMIVAGPGGDTGAAGPVLASVNLHGTVTAIHPIDIADSLLEFGPGNLLRVGDGLRLITRVGGASPGVVMTSRGSDGQAMGGAPVRLINALPMGPSPINQPAIAMASTPDRIWLMWLRAAEGAAPDAIFAVDVVLQGFTTDGTALSPPRVLVAQVDSRDVHAFRVAANSSHVLASWAVQATMANHPYAVFDAVSGAELARRTTTALPPFIGVSVPLAREGQLALSWQVGGIIAGAGAVLLDANFDALSATPGDWQGNLLPPAPLLAVEGPSFTAHEDIWLLWGGQSHLREPLNGNTLSTLTLLTMPAGQGPLTSHPMTIQVRLPATGGEPLTAQGVLVFADRLLLYGRSNDNKLVTVPVWRRN